MKLHRFFGDFDFSQETLEIFDVDLLHQWCNVLRLKDGSKIILMNKNSETAEVVIMQLSEKLGSVKIVDVKRCTGENNRVVLYASILKKQNFEWVVQKATEIGVSEIVPIITKRTVKLGLSRERLEKISKEAVEQSERSFLPVIKDAVSFEEAIELAKSNDTNYFFDRSGEDAVLKSDGSKNIGFFVGPEGGWDEAEKVSARKAGMKIVNLGSNNLRAETAAVVASWVVCNNSDTKLRKVFESTKN